jgi:hypothetical protein
MGLDFIRALAGKPWRKSWDRGLDALKQPTLLDLRIEETLRFVTMDCVPGCPVSVGAEFSLQVDGDRVLVMDCQRHVGAVEHPPADVLKALIDGSGVGVGSIVRCGTFGDTADLRITG